MPEHAAGSSHRAVGADAGALGADAGARTRARGGVLAVGAAVIGLAALVLGFIPATHFFGAVAGVIGLPLGLYSQLVSISTNERWLNVVGMVASFVGAAFALRHGGFSI
ncbi:hypothetical protein [Actinomadura hibisca]|uniref:hypothetical protein n=1 Tax=Actinomadura hibisca TaxID=68565 RepID=UPI00082C8DBC|nr:hypothetical protein [Actinomadura hibisca]